MPKVLRLRKYVRKITKKSDIRQGPTVVAPVQTTSGCGWYGIEQAQSASGTDGAAFFSICLILQKPPNDFIRKHL